MDKRISKINIKISVFSIAFVLGINSAGVAPVLGLLSKAFKGESANAIQTLQTIPFFLLVIASIFIGWLVTKISKKKLALVGLFLVALIGISPFFIGGFSFMMISRLLVGVGFGIISPLSTAIISEFFKGKDRASMMGLHVIGMGMGGMCTNLIGGILGGTGYQKFFLIYLISIIAFIIVIKQLPDTGAEIPNEAQRLKLNRKVYELSFANFFYSLLITAYMTNIGIHIVRSVNGGSALTGVVTAVNAAFALLVGLNFSTISLHFKHYTLPLSIFMASLGYLVLTIMPNSMVGIFIASAFCGISLSCFMVEAAFMLSTAVSQVSITLASGFFGMIGGIGGLVSPIILNSIAKFVFGSVSTNIVFLICMISMFILAVVCYAFVVMSQKDADINSINY